MFRKVVQKGTATLADVDGYEVGGKLVLPKLLKKASIQKKKINTFASIFPSSNPKYVLIVLLEDTNSQKIVYKYQNTNPVPTKVVAHLTQLVGHL